MLVTIPVQDTGLSWAPRPEAVPSVGEYTSYHVAYMQFRHQREGTPGKHLPAAACTSGLALAGGDRASDSMRRRSFTVVTIKDVFLTRHQRTLCPFHLTVDIISNSLS